MCRMSKHMFPFSYVALLIGLLIGVGFTAACVGLFSVGILFVCMSIGMIQIMPLFKFLEKIINNLLPDDVKRIETNLEKTYTVAGNTRLDPGKYIFMWHPHGVFASSMFFHTSTSFTKWPSQLRNTKLVASGVVMKMPFMKELYNEFNTIPSDYHVMKGALESGDSISVSAGGMREMLYENTVLLSRRYGIFKMALETGTPLVPVVSADDSKLWKVMNIPQWIQAALEPYDVCIPIPTFKSIGKYFGILQSPLKDPIRSIIGEPIPVEKVEAPTDSDISALRSKYIEILKTMYKKETGIDLIVK